MVNVRYYRPAGKTPDEPALALFRKQWQLYRKVVDYNYLFHREAYNCLHRILVDEAIQPFRFLDVACGDASATVEALKGTQVASYHGIDLSEAHWSWRARLLRRSPVPSRWTAAILLRPCAIGPSQWMSRGSASRCITSRPRTS